MSDEIRAFDWSSTALGPISTWPLALRMTVRLVLSSNQPMCFWWGEELLSFHNDAYKPMLGAWVEHTLGRPGPEVWAEVWADVAAMIAGALAGGSSSVTNLPLVTTRNGVEELSHWSFTYSPLHDEAGQVAGVLNIVTETTSAVSADAAIRETNLNLAHDLGEAEQQIEAQGKTERRQRLLQRELLHRMKNTLAMVQAIVSQTLRNAEDPREAGEVIAERLKALSQAQDVLTDASWTSAPIEAVVRNALAAHEDGSRIRLHVERSCELSAQQSLGLSLALYELATNASKYGALSTGEGLVEVSWSRGPGLDFAFRWKESGGPAVTPPTRRGFGSRLVDKIVAGYFAGSAKLAYEPDGVLFELRGELDDSLN